jgi:hypothetical protein
MNNDTPRSKGELVIERIMQELDPASERYQILATAKVFKSSWVELGEKLLQVQRNTLFKAWGYDSFEDYCSREVRIKKPTAEKLTLAYRFLEKEEPAMLARHTELKPIPDYRSFDLLRQAREEARVTDEDYAALRRSVIDDERSLPTVRKQFRELTAEPKDNDQHLKTALAAARRLETALQNLPDLPATLDAALRSLLEHLEHSLQPADTENPPWEELPQE